MNTCAAILLGCTLVNVAVGEADFKGLELGRNETETMPDDWRGRSMVEGWSVRSTVKVDGSGISFATDPGLFDAHRYRIDGWRERSGFTSEPGPMNAVQIVLLEGLHPQFLDFGRGAPEERSPTSTTLERTFGGMTRIEQMERHVGWGMSSGSGGTAGGRFRSGDGGYGLALEVVIPLDLDGAPSRFPELTPPGWELGGSALHGGIPGVSGGSVTGGSGNSEGVAVVPLPLPAVLTGVGLTAAILMRGRLRRRGI